MLARGKLRGGGGGVSKHQQWNWEKEESAGVAHVGGGGGSEAAGWCMPWGWVGRGQPTGGASNVSKLPNCSKAIWDLQNWSASEGGDSGEAEFGSVGITPILN